MEDHSEPREDKGYIVEDVVKNLSNSGRNKNIGYKGQKLMTNIIEEIRKKKKKSKDDVQWSVLHSQMEVDSLMEWRIRTDFC